MTRAYHLFERFGVELEYMIVDREWLDVLPVTDEVLRAVAGEYTSDVDAGELSWSNELVLHVVELKTNGPAETLNGLAERFQHDVGRISTLAAAHGGRLMPTAMHPWMNPLRETKLWPHEYSPVYETFHRIFNCQGHGWSNLQSAHLNLPFADDEEFGRLHAAIRLVLPLIPALAASSPLADGRLTGQADTRLDYYRKNALRVPVVCGRVVPEPVYTRADYESDVLARIYAALAPHDPEGILRYEWANARGAIARFDRNTIEIRVIDVQECPLADLAILTLLVAVLRALTEERWQSAALQRAVPVAPLADLLLDTIRSADETPIRNADFLALLGREPHNGGTAGALWRSLRDELLPNGTGEATLDDALDVILRHGCLAQRITRAVGAAPQRQRIFTIYEQLCECLDAGRMFLPA